MNTSGSGAPRGEQAVRVRLGAADCPLAHFAAEHFLQRQNCADMETLAGTAEPRPALAARVLENLSHALPLHLEDEELGLFPLLRSRAMPDDEIGKLIARLEADHAGSGEAAAALSVALRRMAGGMLPRKDDRALLLASAAARRRHLILEDAVLLPLARARLTEADKAGLLAQMLARRSARPEGVAAPAGRPRPDAPPAEEEVPT